MSVCRPSISVALFCLVLACEPGVDPPPSTGLLTDQDPIEVGRLEGVPSLAWAVGASPRVRIGGSDERESQLLVRVGDGAVARDGSIMVTDIRVGAVRVYDASGRFVEKLGTAGDGPGEFRSPADLLVGPADSILVWDQAQWRTSIFSPEGEFVRSVRYDPADPDLFPLRGMWPSRVRLGPEGAYLVRLMGKANAKGANGDAKPREEGVTGFAVHRSGTKDLDLIASLPERAAVQVEAPWGPQEMIPPLAGEPRAAVDPRGLRVCIGHSGIPEILCWSEAASRASVRWVPDRGSVQAQDPDVVEWWQETSAAYSQKLSPREVEEALSQVPLPPVEPAFRGLHLDKLGFLWVELGPVNGHWTEWQYLILDQDLRAVGTLNLPPFRILEIGEEHLLGVQEDAVGREEVVLYSLARQ